MKGKSSLTFHIVNGVITIAINSASQGHWNRLQFE